MVGQNKLQQLAAKVAVRKHHHLETGADEPCHSRHWH